VASFGSSNEVCESGLSVLCRIYKPSRGSMLQKRQANLVLLEFEKEIPEKIDLNIFVNRFSGIHPPLLLGWCGDWRIMLHCACVAFYHSVSSRLCWFAWYCLALYCIVLLTLCALIWLLAWTSVSVFLEAAMCIYCRWKRMNISKVHWLRCFAVFLMNCLLQMRAAYVK